MTIKDKYKMTVYAALKGHELALGTSLMYIEEQIRATTIPDARLRRRHVAVQTDYEQVNELLRELVK